MEWFGHIRVPAIDVGTAAAEVRRGAVLVDVGSPREWLGGHVPGARLVRVGMMEHDLAPLPVDQRIIVFARDRGRMSEVVERLRQGGRDAVAIRGGAEEWRRQGLPLTVSNVSAGVTTHESRHHEDHRRRL